MKFRKTINPIIRGCNVYFNIKFYHQIDISEEDAIFESETGTFINNYAKECFNEIIKKLRYSWVKDFYFDGRSNGYFVIETDIEDLSKKEKQLYRIAGIVETYYENYAEEIEAFYK